MSTRASNRPPGSGPADPDAPHESDVRSTLERILPDLIRRGFEVGRGPLEKVGESTFVRDMTAQVISQLGDVRSGVVKAVAQEVGRFLREADIASEVRKVLIGLNIEAQVKLKFSAREDGGLKPEFQVELGASDARKPPAK